jgi:archaellum biogenesis ATPase FlaH
MTKYLDDDLVKKISESDKLTADERRNLFKKIAKEKSFALINLKEGLPPLGSSKDITKKFKEPLRNDWQLTASNDNQNVNFQKIDKRAGIVCGEKSGIIVLDIDDIQKFKAWAKAREIENPIPATFTVKSKQGTDRNHYYFKYPSDGREYKNRSVHETFDIRSKGGQVLCPGSIHPETHKPYTVIDNREIAEAPEWLREYSHDKDGFEKRHKAYKKMKENFLNADGSVDINKLKIPDHAKEKIQTSYPIGQRSEPSGSVLLSLLRAKVLEEIIRKIFAEFPIGDKARERPDWFEKEIETATQKVKATTKKAENKNYYENTSAWTLKNIVEKPDTFEFLIENFWPKGENLLITGKGGTGKSLFALNMALDLTLQPGLLFLDQFAVPKKKKVLFVQSENTYLGTKKRFLNIIQKYPQYKTIINEIYFMGWNEDIRVYGDFNEDSYFREAVDRTMNEIEPDVVIMDPLISFHRKDENSNDKMRYVLDDITQFFADRKVDICLIHHESKSGKSGGRGASAIQDWSANCFALTYSKSKDKDKDKEKETLILEHKKARNFELNLNYNLAKDNLRFYVGGSTSQGQTQIAGQKQIHNLILKALDKCPNKTSTSGVGGLFNDVHSIYVSAGNTLSRSVFDKAIAELESQGKIKLIKSGKTKNYSKI